MRLGLMLALMAWLCETTLYAQEVKGMKVLMLGDSHTSLGMPEAVQGPLNGLSKDAATWTLIKAGVGGETLGSGKNRLEALLNQHQPNVLTVMYGGNDLWKKVTSEQFRSHMLAVIEMAQKHASRPQVMLLTSPPVDAKRHFLGKAKYLNDQGGVDLVLEQQYHAVTRQVAAEKGLPLIDIHRRIANEAAWETCIKPDGVHLSESGYAIAGKHIADAIAGWYGAEVIKAKAAIAVRDGAAANLKKISGANAKDDAARAALLAKFDEIWKACPWLPEQSAAWHAVNYSGQAAAK
jgi:lysophospholipase L1-like esterase